MNRLNVINLLTDDRRHCWEPTAPSTSLQKDRSRSVHRELRGISKTDLWRWIPLHDGAAQDELILWGSTNLRSFEVLVPFSQHCLAISSSDLLSLENKDSSLHFVKMWKDGFWKSTLVRIFEQFLWMRETSVLLTKNSFLSYFVTLFLSGEIELFLESILFIGIDWRWEESHEQPWENWNTVVSTTMYWWIAENVSLKRNILSLSLSSWIFQSPVWSSVFLFNADFLSSKWCKL